MQTPDVLDDLTRQVGNLAKLARSGEMETTVILLPASASASRWAEPTAHMHRRQASEAHISAYGKTVETSSSSASSKNDEEGSVFYKSSPSASASKSVPACFSSEESCLSGTDSCSGHGTCTNRFPKSKDACFTCHCLSTVNEKSGSLTHWAGKTCAKQDISTPFWLFGGFALLMATILTLSIGMLYSVGEEKMPGVLGAGVSKSSS